jgi:hypothetical protein
MSFSYDLSDLATELNRLRLEIGYVDSNDYFLDDEEIAIVQSEKTSFYRRAAACCELVCAKVAREVKSKIGHFSEDSNEIYVRYRALADKFYAYASTSYPWSSAISISEKETYEDDTSLVQPKIKLGIHDNN